MALQGWVGKWVSKRQGEVGVRQVEVGVRQVEQRDSNHNHMKHPAMYNILLERAQTSGAHDHHIAASLVRLSNQCQLGVALQNPHLAGDTLLVEVDLEGSEEVDEAGLFLEGGR